MPEPEHTDTSTWSDQAYQQYSLQGVSRTFVLTISQLPDALETAGGNGYLLCRIADMIEDAPELSFEKKREFSLLFDRVVRGCASAEEFSPPAKIVDARQPLPN
jgi:farnesyl-diphosphate farnesyltransferase